MIVFFGYHKTLNSTPQFNMMAFRTKEIQVSENERLQKNIALMNNTMKIIEI